MRTAPVADKRHDLIHAALGIASEAGELLTVIKREHAYGKPLDWVNMDEEAGDILWFVSLYCRASGRSLEDLARMNIAKLKARFPDKFTQEAALNRNVDNERKSIESISVGTGINHPV